jgi:divalent metal cation (Fe/Co/Zn/Cd) transporter
MAQSLLDNAAEHEAIVRRGRRLAYLTVACTAIEAAGGLTAAALARSTALAGFGADSLIEVFSALVVLWRLKIGAAGERREQRALRLIGGSLIALAAYVAYRGVAALVFQDKADNGWLGVGVALFSIVAMRWLAAGKRRVAAELESGAVRADSVQSQICSYLAIILLVGLGLQWVWGMWWADPVAALAMVPLIVSEGWEAWRGNACCHHAVH